MKTLKSMIGLSKQESRHNGEPGTATCLEKPMDEVRRAFGTPRTLKSAQ
jgi:hypothetical protein